MAEVQLAEVQLDEAQAEALVQAELSQAHADTAAAREERDAAILRGDRAEDVGRKLKLEVEAAKKGVLDIRYRGVDDQPLTDPPVRSWDGAWAIVWFVIFCLGTAAVALHNVWMRGAQRVLPFWVAVIGLVGMAGYVVSLATFLIPLMGPCFPSLWNHPKTGPTRAVLTLLSFVATGASVHSIMAFFLSDLPRDASTVQAITYFLVVLASIFKFGVHDLTAETYIIIVSPAFIYRIGTRPNRLLYRLKRQLYRLYRCIVAEEQV